MSDPGTVPGLVARCVVTGAEREVKAKSDGAPTLPFGWKSVEGETYSPEGLAQAFVRRAVTVSVASVLRHGDEDSPEARAVAWADFRRAARRSGVDVARASNAIVARLFAADVAEPLKEGPKGPKLPPLPKQNLYAVARQAAPDLFSQTAGAVALGVLADYKADRWAVRLGVGVKSKSLRSYRSPQPIPVPADKCQLRLEGADATLTVRVGEGRFRLVLRGGRFKTDRHLRTLVAALASGGKLGEVTLREERAHGTHRNGGETRERGGSTFGTRFRVSVVLLVRRQGRLAPEGEKPLVVKTDPEALLVCLDADGDKLFTLHEPQVRRWVAEYRRKLQMVADDQKLERRVPKANAASLDDYRTRLGDKHHKRLADFCHKAAAIVVNHAVRRRCTVVRWDDKDQGYVQSFPWFKLRQMAEDKCKEFGLTFEAKPDSDD